MFTDAVLEEPRRVAVTIAGVGTSTGRARALQLPVVDPAVANTDVWFRTSRFELEVSESDAPVLGAGPLSV
jgi:hypothetical protein